MIHRRRKILLSGVTTVGTAATRIVADALIASLLPDVALVNYKRLTIVGDSNTVSNTNNAMVYIGDSSVVSDGSNFGLKPGESITFETGDSPRVYDSVDVEDLYCIAAGAGQKLKWILFG